MSDTGICLYCRESNYDKIEKFVTSPDICGSIDKTHTISSRQSVGKYLGTTETLVVFVLYYGDNPENLTKVQNFMKLLGDASCLEAH